MKRKDCDDKCRTGPAPRSRWIGAVAVLALAWCSASARAQTVGIWSEGVVDSDQVCLGDVTRLDGFSDDQAAALKQLVVGPAPQAGQNRLVGSDEIRQSLEQSGVNLAMVCVRGASQCRVRRPLEIKESAPEAIAPIISAQDLSLGGEIRRFLQQRFETAAGTLEIQFSQAPPALLALSKPEYHFDVACPDDLKLGLVRLKVKIGRGQDPPVAEQVAVVVSLGREVCVAVENLNRGQAVRRQDVKIEKRIFTRWDRMGLADPAAVVGQQVNRFVAAGEVIEQDDVQAMPLVKRNDLVRILSNSGGITLESSAKALDGGALGDIIEVRNESSKSTFKVRVSGPRQAQAVDDGIENVKVQHEKT